MTNVAVGDWISYAVHAATGCGAASVAESNLITHSTPYLVGVGLETTSRARST